MSKTNRSLVVCAAALVLAPCPGVNNAGGDEIAKAGEWSYVPHADTRPVARSIQLFEEPPEDLVEEVEYRGTLRRYAQLRYGSENSRRVAIVVDELPDGEFTLLVDADRDRTITASDIIGGEGRTRTLQLAAEIIREAEAERDTRQVQIRLSAARNRMSVATLGCVRGEIPWSDTAGSTPTAVQVRRIDGNANGLFADARDRLRIDLNRDGTWDAVTEQFVHLPVLNIGGQRYAVRSDRLGRSFSLAEITGIGNLRVVAAKLPKSARVLAFEAMIFSNDGSAYSLKEMDKPLAVPVGRYTLGSVTMTIDTGKSEPWHFVFSRGGSVNADAWIDVAANGDVSLEAIGKPRFVLEVGKQTEVAGGDTLHLQPRLYTEDGLLINLSCRGREIGSFASERTHNKCHIQLVSEGDEVVSSARSGFA